MRITAARWQDKTYITKTGRMVTKSTAKKLGMAVLITLGTVLALVAAAGASAVWGG